MFGPFDVRRSMFDVQCFPKFPQSSCMRSLRRYDGCVPFRLRDYASIGVLLSGLVFFHTDVCATERSQWFARPWQTEDGLPNNTVFGIVQTPDGYLWLGTPTGLVRFDGASFEEFS